MGDIRNGARTGLKLLAQVCKLSRLNGFRGGVESILGENNATTFFGLWDPLCQFIEVLIGLDNWFNQIDHTKEQTQGEDIGSA